MNLQAFDLMLAGILCILLPLFGVWSHRRLRAQVRAGAAAARLDAYLLTMVVEWGLVLSVLGLWFLTRRDLSELGLGLSLGPGWWIGLALGVAACAALVLQTIDIRRNPEKLEAVRGEIGSLRDLLPRDRREGNAFSALSVTAGICEELLYRGFLIAVLVPLVGTIGAVVLSSLAFGVGHAYQGPRGILKTGAVGLVMAGLFLLTGSLWVPMLVHAVVDLNSGYLGRRSLESAPGTTSPACC